MRLSPLMQLCGEEYQEVRPRAVDQQAKHELLKEFYGEEALDLDIENFDDGIAKVRDQVKKVCDYMVGAGFTNFSALNKKFHDLGNARYMNKPSVSRQIKDCMESILYVFKTSSNEQKLKFANRCKDRKFDCGEGTYTNLVMVYSELTLTKQNIGALIGFAKRQLAEQVLLEKYRNNEFAPQFKFEAGYEIHHIPNLINAVAEKYRLAVKNKNEDQYFRNVPEAIAAKVDNALKAAFSNNQALLAMVDGIVETVCSALPNEAEHHHLNSFGKEIQDFFDQLGVKLPSGYACLAETDNRGHAKKYKRNFSEIIKHILIVHMQDVGIITSQEYAYAKRVLALESSFNDDGTPCVTKELFDASENKDEDWKYVCSNALPLDTEGFGVTNPFLYEARKIEGKESIQWFIDKNKKIKGLNPLIYALEHLDQQIVRRQRLTEAQLSCLLFEVNKPDSVTALVKLGAKVDVVNGEHTPLTKAIELGKVEVVKQILVELKQRKQGFISKFLGWKGDFEKALYNSRVVVLAASRDDPKMLSVVLDEIDAFAKENNKPNLLFDACFNEFDILIEHNKYRCCKVILDRLAKHKNFKNHLQGYRNRHSCSYLALSCKVGSGEIFEALLSAMELDQDSLLKICSEHMSRNNILHILAQTECDKSVLKSLLSRIEDVNKVKLANLCQRGVPYSARFYILQDPEKAAILLDCFKDNNEALYTLLSGIDFDELVNNYPKSFAAIVKSLKTNEAVLNSVLTRVAFDRHAEFRANKIEVILGELKDATDVFEKVLARFDANRLLTYPSCERALKVILGFISDNEFLLRKFLFVHVGNNNFQSRIAKLIDEGRKISDAVLDAVFTSVLKHEDMLFDVLDNQHLLLALHNASKQTCETLVKKVKNNHPNLFAKFIEPQENGADSLFMTAVKFNSVQVVKCILECVGSKWQDVLKLYDRRDSEGKGVLRIAAIMQEKEMIDALWGHASIKLMMFIIIRNASKAFYNKCSIYASTAANVVYENRVGIAKAAIITGVSVACVYASISSGAHTAMAA